MENNIQLREPIRWVDEEISHGFVGGIPLLSVTKRREAYYVNLITVPGEKHPTLLTAKKAGERIFTDWLNSIATCVNHKENL